MSIVAGPYLLYRTSAGIVDQAELDGVLLQWGNAAALSGAGAVPEPSTLAILFAAMALLLLQRRARG